MRAARSSTVVDFDQVRCASSAWDLYGETLFRLKDRHGREMLLGPTQEEVVAAARRRGSSPPTATCP